MPSNPHPHHALLAVATDLLAQLEAQHRAALRVEQTVRVLTIGAGVVAPLQRLREQLEEMRESLESERTLLDEFERALTTVHS